MVREFKLPDVGEGLTEAEIVSWLVEVGDAVSEDQPVAEVETDKAVVEVPAPVNGTVREILAEEGEMVPVGEVIITFDVEGEPVEPADEGESEPADPGDADPAASEASGPAASTDGESDGEVSAKGGRVFAAPSARRLARELGVDIETVPGSGPGGRVTEGDVRAAAESGGEPAGTETADEEPEPAVRSATRKVTDEAESEADAKPAPADAHPGGAPEAAGRDRTLAAPATRQVAQEEGIDINDVPTDEIRDGEPFVDAEQVRSYAEAQRVAQEADAAAVRQESAAVDATAETPPDTETTAEGEVERRPYRGIRRTIGKAMENSKYTAPHVTHHDTVVVEDLVDTRARLKPKAEERGIKLTYMPFVVKAIVAALKEHPILNSQLNEDEEEILVKRYHNIGIAVATDAGLMVPVVKDADGKGMLTIASEVNELAAKARDRSISREEMQGGTFSITNFGAIGGEYATPIINYPETGILGLGELKQRPVVEDGEVVAKWTLPISLSIDHRVIDGADAAQFANTLMEYLSNPELLLLE
ncbi:2-oxo acid dehydrogenase subunit E2 [Haloglomus irregulare]|jgi:pyruvate dehydrogenase E2 component (dihydrolipoamide acetyltransferase)|uniref:2-oxo acid dehydrogenase subunit E2 n=1 Tax=Haloglomus irregulare TaxID=2234134 RepID=A0A554MXY4_9EURY|nr:2-oxo acid dehydrogenase subunit E2 [Haloglomus irregulare]TSD09984.1 2-oxo acid dehydrogenase subunit E2 [Haloglomus irregulare]